MTYYGISIRVGQKAYVKIMNNGQSWIILLEIRHVEYGALLDGKNVMEGVFETRRDEKNNDETEKQRITTAKFLSR